MPGVEMVWFYEESVDNILLQHRMATLSKWDINYSTCKYRISGRIIDLSYNVVTSEGVKCRFTPTNNRLHVFEVKPRSNNAVFGREVIDNLTDRGNDMCHVGFRNDGDTNDTGVFSAENSNNDNHRTDLGDTNDRGVSSVENSNNDMPSIIPEEPAIQTIEGSRKAHSKRDRIKADIV